MPFPSVALVPELWSPPSGARDLLWLCAPCPQTGPWSEHSHRPSSPLLSHFCAVECLECSTGRCPYILQSATSFLQTPISPPCTLLRSAHTPTIALPSSALGLSTTQRSHNLPLTTPRPAAHTADLSQPESSPALASRLPVTFSWVCSR